MSGKDVADSIQSLGAVQIYDTFHDDLDGEGNPYPTVSVYDSREGQDA